MILILLWVISKVSPIHSCEESLEIGGLMTMSEEIYHRVIHSWFAQRDRGFDPCGDRDVIMPLCGEESEKKEVR